jgi:hypothetical protein
MSAIHEGLTVEFVRACFRYDEDAGKLYWKVRATGRKSANIGDEAGGTSHRGGYRRITVFGRTIMAHRIAWAIYFGEWPPDSLQIDHINGDTGDNRLINLRLATPSQNQGNRGGRKSPQSSRFRGVGWFAQKNCWRARLADEHLGLFETEETAARAYDRAAIARFGDYAKLNFEETRHVEAV